jgi:hypothetical protein
MAVLPGWPEFMVNPASTLGFFRSQKVMERMPAFSMQGVEAEILNAGNQLHMPGTRLMLKMQEDWVYRSLLAATLSECSLPTSRLKSDNLINL